MNILFVIQTDYQRKKRVLCRTILSYLMTMLIVRSIPCFFQVEYVLAMIIPLNNNLIKVSWNPPFRESPFYFAIIVKMGGFIVLIGYL